MADLIPTVNPAHHRTSTKEGIRNCQRASMTSAFFRPTRPAIQIFPHACEMKAITVITNLQRKTNPHHLEVKYAQASAPSLGRVHQTRRSSLLSLLFTRSCFPRSTTRAAHRGLAQLFSTCTSLLLAMAYDFELLRLHGFLPRAPCNSACGRAGKLMPEERMAVAQFVML